MNKDFYGFNETCNVDNILKDEKLEIKDTFDEQDSKKIRANIRDDLNIDYIDFSFEKDILTNIFVKYKKNEENSNKELFVLIKNILSQDFNKPSLNIPEIEKINKEEFNQQINNSALIATWNNECVSEFPENIEYIRLIFEKEEGEYILKANCAFCTKKAIFADEDDLSISDVVEQESIGYNDEEVADEVKDDKREEVIEKEKNEKKDIDFESINLFIKRNVKEKKYKYIIFGVVFIWLWLLALSNQFIKSFNNLEWINIIYFLIYFAFTVFSCIIPCRITGILDVFRSTESNDRKYLTDSSVKVNPKTCSIWEAYKSTFFDENLGIKNRTRASSDLYFNYESVINEMDKSKIPLLATFKNFASSFMGLGILGTFIGFAVGLSQITFSAVDTSLMLNSIEILVKNGLSTAFNTSIIGVLFSLVYTYFIYNPLVKKYTMYFENLSDQLDMDFYISETEALMQYTMVTGENSENITFSQSLRFIVENMNKQTDALNNFNDNLADKIANMQQSVNGAMEKLGSEVGGQLGEYVTDKVQDELGNLKLSLSETAKQIIEASEKMSETPELIEKANSSFADYTTSFEHSLSSAKEAAELLYETPDKIKNIESILLEKQETVAKKFEDSSNILRSIIEDINITDEKLDELVTAAKINEDNSGKNLKSIMEETNIMLEGFKRVDSSLKGIFDSISKEIVKYNTTVGNTLDKYLSSFEKGSKTFATSISGTMSDFESTIDAFGENIRGVQEVSSKFEQSVTRLSKELNPTTEKSVAKRTKK